MQSVVDEINDDGGIGGRQIEVEIMLVDGVAGPEAGQAACIEMTEDFGAFAVILAPAISRDIARCTRSPTRPSRSTPRGSTRRSTTRPRAGCSALGSDTSMSHRSPVRGLGAARSTTPGELDGKTIGIVTAEQSPEFPAAVETAWSPRSRSWATRSP